jgi:hypothetical protein
MVGEAELCLELKEEQGMSREEPCNVEVILNSISVCRGWRYMSYRVTRCAVVAATEGICAVLYVGSRRRMCLRCGIPW